MNVVSKIAPGTAFKIEKGIPIPPSKGGAGRPTLYPFAKMEVGDSFTIESARKQQGRMCAIASDYGKRHGMRFTVRTIGDGMLRVWRVA